MEIYKDTDFMLSSEKSNKILAVLTIIFTLAIPATVIGTFYGMNINYQVDLKLEMLECFWSIYCANLILLASVDSSSFNVHCTLKNADGLEINFA